MSVPSSYLSSFVVCAPIGVQSNVVHNENTPNQNRQSFQAHVRGITTIESTAAQPALAFKKERKPWVNRAGGPCAVCRVMESLRWHEGPNHAVLCNRHGLRYKEFKRLVPDQKWVPGASVKQALAQAQTKAKMRLSAILNESEILP